jgi:hypothetical protein
MPAPEVAVNYYTGGDMYLFGMFLSIFDLDMSTRGTKFVISHFQYYFPQMNFKPPEFQILEGLL